MRTFRNGVIKFFVTYALVMIVFLMLPVFLITDQVPLFNSMIDYLFNNKVPI